MVITIYVDDIFILGAKRKEINNIMQFLKIQFYISNLELVSFNLETAIIWEHANHNFCLEQQAFLEKIFWDHGILDCKIVIVPIDEILIATPQEY